MRLKRSLFLAAFAAVAMLGSSGLGALPVPPFLEGTKQGPLDVCEYGLSADGKFIVNLFCDSKDFADVDLSGRRLEVVWFYRTNLQRANLSGSRLDNSWLRCSQLERTNFTDASLGSTDFAGSAMNWANFTEARIHHARFNQYQCDEGSNEFTAMMGVDMTRATFEHTTIEILDNAIRTRQPPRFEMRRANYTRANLRDVRLKKVDLRLSTFRGASLRQMVVDYSNAGCSDFTNSVWSRPSSTAKFSDFSGADFTDAKVENTIFLGSKLTGAIFTRAELTNVLFGDADLTYADFTEAKISGQQDFRGANLSGATWIDGTRCTQGSIGECRTDGPPMPPDPNPSPYFPPGAAYLVDSVAEDQAKGHPEDSSFYLDCPYSKIDYRYDVEGTNPYADAPNGYNR